MTICTELLAVVVSAGISGVDGPVVITHSIPEATAFTTLNGERAFSAGAVWCNVGDEQAPWNGSTSDHPVTAVNLVRVENGVLEQLGGSWAWHHFCTLQMQVCSTCQPAGGGCAASLGIGCANTSSAGAMGIQNLLGRRSDVNAFTGEFPYPFTAPPVTSSLDRRCRAFVDDIDPAQHPGASFAFESLTITANGSVGALGYGTRRVAPASLLGSPVFQGLSEESSTAIEFWKSVEPSVEIVDVLVPNEGQIKIGARVAATERGWRYDYAIENINSHESVGGFALPLGLGASATNLRFHAPLAHSGEVTSNEPWTMDVSADEVNFATESFATNANANAVRWGTTYTFGFDSDRAPTTAIATLTLFRSGSDLAVMLPAPSGPSADLNGDGAVGGADLAILLGSWGRCGGCVADLDGDGVVGNTDLALLLGAWDAR